MPKLNLVASSKGAIPPKVLKHMVLRKPVRFCGEHGSQLVIFVLKVAALEAVRRISRARCSFVWQAIQALQLICYPPFKWIQRWKPLNMLVNGVQNFSRPMLFLSIATTFSDQSENKKQTVDGTDGSPPDSESPNEPSSSELRSCNDDVDSIASKSWLVRVIEELEKQGISLPERINEDELRRFYTAANGDISSLLSSLKKTIRWRETYYILSTEELDMWSHLVFWHGIDVKLRPCLVIRLGLACCTLRPHDRPRFAQALVSQVDHGVQHLINKANPTITVLMDCEGLTPMRFPMQMLRSFSSLLQNHYPNRLGALYVVRLPPVVRVITQTFIQVLKPTTREKLRIEGETYQKVLSELLQAVPTFLGGKCKCSNCRMLLAGNPSCESSSSSLEETRGRRETVENLSEEDDDESSSVAYAFNEFPPNGSCDHVLRSALLVILMLLIACACFGGDLS